MKAQSDKEFEQARVEYAKTTRKHKTTGKEPQAPFIDYQLKHNLEAAYGNGKKDEINLPYKHQVKRTSMVTIQITSVIPKTCLIVQTQQNVAQIWIAVMSRLKLGRSL